ncbi:sulfurtransferase complex subunit TusC [Microbulbifer hainanensis]|uniref:sulfurtransferase complex subunit TusC n=1 Tax=Microbulbifer hainanensis TaxID=2735675 RepID=UPI001866E3E0|nr:sulfurtransferase complex subunit TusC [Microbulbifer hainanensis]
MANRTLAICRQAPYGSALAREGLEAVLAAAAMDQSPELLFVNDGVFQLLDGQEPAAIEQKSLQRNLQALPMFGVETLHVCKLSLSQRGIDPAQLQITGAEIVLVVDVGKFIAGFDIALNF